MKLSTDPHLVDKPSRVGDHPVDAAFTADFAPTTAWSTCSAKIGYDDRLHTVESELRMREPGLR
ncbi:MAG TPA: hypothetical protein VM121_08965 [Acidimicrobiales bacterium]|nr:hypothetical protein [Acidimicrobiales bacterium]